MRDCDWWSKQGWPGLSCFPNAYLDWVHVSFNPGAQAGDDYIRIKIKIVLYGVSPSIYPELKIRFPSELPDDYDFCYVEGAAQLPPRLPNAMVYDVTCTDSTPGGDGVFANQCIKKQHRKDTRCRTQRSLQQILDLFLSEVIIEEEDYDPCIDQCNLEHGDDLALCDQECGDLEPCLTQCKEDADREHERRLDLCDQYYRKHVRELVKNHGGIRLSTNDIFILMPSADNLCLGPDLCIDPAWLPWIGPVDLPRYVKEMLDKQVEDILADPDHKYHDFVAGADISVVCRHDNDCDPSEPDTDGDGICDRIDYCRYLFTGGNWDHDGDGLGDGKGGLDCLPHKMPACRNGENCPIACRAECDPCPYFPVEPTIPLDLNGNGIADSCDPDIDGDGILNQFDCLPYNKNALYDRDGDGSCEGVTRQKCSKGCQEMYASYFWEKIEDYVENTADPDHERQLWRDWALDRYAECLDVCDRSPDNCISINAGICSHITECAKVEGDCLSLGCTEKCYGAFCPNNGLRLCSPDTTLCSIAYGNPTQANHNAVQEQNNAWYPKGDRCELAAVSLERIFVRDDTARVRFRSHGGGINGFAQSPEDLFTRERRFGFGLGACRCDETEFDLETGKERWKAICWQTICPRNAEQPPSVLNNAWDPITSTECGSLSYRGDNPVVDANNLCQDRWMEMIHDDNLNLYEWSWDWKNHYDLDFFPYQIDLDTERTGSQTVLRAVFTKVAGTVPAYESDPAVAQEVAFSDLLYMGQRMIVPQSLLKSIGLWERQILKIIPEVADSGWLDDPVPVDVARAWVLTRSQATDTWFLERVEDGLTRTGIPVEVVYSSEVSPRLDGTAPIKATTGLLDTSHLGLDQGTKQAIFLYQWSGDTAQAPRLFMGAPSQTEALLVTTEDLFGDQPPAFSQHALMFDGTTERLYLFGRYHSMDAAPGDLHSMTYLDLKTGRWAKVRPVGMQPELLGDYSVSPDPARRRALLFGGYSANQDPSDRLYWLDLDTETTTQVEYAEPSTDVRRRGHAAHLEPGSQTLYVFGGRKEENGQLVPSSDILRFDLTTGRWFSYQSADPGLPGPSGQVDPFVFFDHPRGMLWIGDADPSTQQQDLALYAAAIGEPDQTPEFNLFRLGSLLKGDAAPQESFYLSSAPSVHYHYVAGEVDPPGRLLVASLSSNAQSLRLRVADNRGDILNRTDFRRLAGSYEPGEGQSVAFLGQKEKVYTLVVKGGPDLAGSVPTQYSVQVQNADLVEQGGLFMGYVPDLEVVGGVVVAAFPFGLMSLSVADPENIQVMSILPLWGMPKAMALIAGRYAAVVKGGIHGLVIADLADPSAMTTASSIRISHPARDVAAWNKKVFLAQGLRGVGVFDLSDPFNPVFEKRLLRWEHIVSVAVLGPYLIAGTWQGDVKIIDLRSEEAQVVATLQTGPWLSRLETFGSLLHVIKVGFEPVSMFDLTTPQSPVPLGHYTGPERSLGRARFVSDLVIVPEQWRIVVSRAVPVQP